ncbi:MAG: nucleotide exchange factor GrpE [Congregibacter sp.]
MAEQKPDQGGASESAETPDTAAQDPIQDPIQDAAEAVADALKDAQAHAAEGADAVESDTSGTPDSELEQLRAELETARDQVLRAHADAQNVKRRAEQDVEKARKYALERFSGELLPVVDNLERALESAGGDDEAIKPIAEGVELTLKSFQDVLGKFAIEALDPVGEPFDPQLHQAMSMIESPDAEPNTVLTVLQKGYTLNQRLIRPAMVMVSKAPAGS